MCVQELWCKKVPPSQSQLLACQHHPSKVPREDPGPPPPLPDQAAVARLAAAADKIGVLLQNHHQGFLPNKRQQRMGGLAALELVQAVRQLVSPTLTPQRPDAPQGSLSSSQPTALPPTALLPGANARPSFVCQWFHWRAARSKERSAAPLR